MTQSVIPKVEEKNNHLVSEQALLGAIIIDNQYLTGSKIFITDDCFRDPRHKSIWNSFIEIESSGDPIDIVTVADKVRNYDVSVELSYLVELTEKSPTAQNMDYYAKLVLSNYSDRRFRETILLHNALPVIDGNRLVEALKLIQEQSLVSMDKNIHTCERVKKEIEDDLNNSDDSLTESLRQNHFPRLDELSAPVKKELIIVSGITSVGKTSFMLRYMFGLMKKGSRGAYFLYEGSPKSLHIRILAQELHIPIQKIRMNVLDDNERKRIISLCDDFTDEMVYFENCTNISNLISTLSLFTENNHLDFIVIDHIHLIDLGGKEVRAGTMEITRKLLALARKLNIVVFALAQFRKEAEGKETQRPHSNMIRESSTIKQDADRIWLLHDPIWLKEKSEEIGIKGKLEKYKRAPGLITSEPTHAEIIVEKNREGTTGIIRVVTYDS